MIDEDEDVPEVFELPEVFIKKVKKLTLLGYAGKLEIKGDENNTRINIPGSFTEQMKGFGALVFSSGYENF